MLVRVELSTMSGCTVCWDNVVVMLVLWLMRGFSVMWSELLMTSAISCPLWSSVYECQSGVCVHISCEDCVVCL